MVTRRGWERGPFPCFKRNKRTARPTHGRPSRPSSSHQPKMPHSVTLSRSEGSRSRRFPGSLWAVEMLLCAQHDSPITHTDAWINVFMCILGPLQDTPPYYTCFWQRRNRERKAFPDEYICLCKIVSQNAHFQKNFQVAYQK